MELDVYTIGAFLYKAITLVRRMPPLKVPGSWVNLPAIANAVIHMSLVCSIGALIVAGVSGSTGDD